MKKFDVIIVGAGTSGMMATIAAAEAGAQVLLIEKNRRVGKKLLMTGGGRCNVTNNRPAEEIISFIPGNGKFLYSAFSQFDNYDIMNFFESNGIHLKEEDHGRMFPVTDKSKSIVDALFNRINELGVTVFTKTQVTKLLRKDDQIIGVETELEKIYAPCVVLTTGGRTYPSTGATGDGYKLAKKMGHTISPLYPTESPIISEEPFILDKTLQGLSLQDVNLTVLNQKGKPLVNHQMDMLFTHFGISGPAALRCSSFINQELTRNGNQPVTVALDVFPTKSFEEVLEEVPAKQLTEKQRLSFVELLKDFQFTVTKTLPLEKSFVTGGGISLKEVTPKTMESKLVNGLFFAGELLDINGYTGGYNVTAAFVTGHVAGSHAAEIAEYTYLPIEEV
ncbi:NAD(P)/FAD-dependent oxidoreductase [Enterococcus faecalis]|uniref:NAD(P)/FAD-dependent oxidoreductase n=1 Tax=Enterococcus faecalis TaxID=1351 RepID=UPI00338E464F